MTASQSRKLSGLPKPSLLERCSMASLSSPPIRTHAVARYFWKRIEPSLCERSKRSEIRFGARELQNARFRRLFWSRNATAGRLQCKEPFINPNPISLIQRARGPSSRLIRKFDN